MSLQIEPLPDDHVRAEIGKLMAEIVNLAAQQAKLNSGDAAQFKSALLPRLGYRPGGRGWCSLLRHADVHRQMKKRQDAHD